MPPSLWSSLGWFVVIVAAIPAVLWLLKRSPVGRVASPGGTLRNIAALPLSASQRIVTVEVGHGEARRWLVLGVTPQAITTLHTLVPPEDDETGIEPPATPPSFAAALARTLARRGAGAGAPR